MSIALALREYSDALAAGGAPAPSSVRTRKDGQEVAVVSPASVHEMPLTLC